ncbi:Integrase core domain-containing protein [Desulfacinum hydrothermale DSM 13146]|uniref:Integrase core domain-containing protein n=1 Tax=Desulfacinum hydrothermale DSM 13146 TaxID=1121390 RepID=A0A1W1XJ24_9BACT|nr:Integrase core domain-containing protein [Desulfacinum hydrothermale DSM 13146]
MLGADDVSHSQRRTWKRQGASSAGAAARLREARAARDPRQRGLVVGHYKVIGPRQVDLFLPVRDHGHFQPLRGRWMVAHRESAALAKRLIEETCKKQGIVHGQLTAHADRGSSMTSKCVAQLLSDLGVTKTHSRPYVSNDNPCSEAQFKTLKYRPQFPGRFGSIEDPRSFCRNFFSIGTIENIATRVWGWSHRSCSITGWRLRSWSIVSRFSSKHSRPILAVSKARYPGASGIADCRLDQQAFERCCKSLTFYRGCLIFIDTFRCGYDKKAGRNRKFGTFPLFLEINQFVEFFLEWFVRRFFFRCLSYIRFSVRERWGRRC